MTEMRVEGIESLVRDGQTGAILNKDEHELIKYKKRKIELLRERDKEMEFDRLKNEVSVMKSLLVEIYEKVINNK